MISYSFEGAYSALVAALPGWSVDLNDGIEVWNRKGDPDHISAIIYTDKGVGGWSVSHGPRVVEWSTREYDGFTRAEVDAIVADVLAAIRRVEAEGR